MLGCILGLRPCTLTQTLHYLLGVAVLELDSHPDHNKGPEPVHLAHILRSIPFIDPNYTT